MKINPMTTSAVRSAVIDPAAVLLPDMLSRSYHREINQYAPTATPAVLACVGN
jgi:hypothetical protein